MNWKPPVLIIKRHEWVFLEFSAETIWRVCIRGHKRIFRGSRPPFKLLKPPSPLTIVMVETTILSMCLKLYNCIPAVWLQRFLLTTTCWFYRFRAISTWCINLLPNGNLIIFDPLQNYLLSRWKGAFHPKVDGPSFSMDWQINNYTVEDGHIYNETTYTGIEKDLPIICWIDPITAIDE